jgi:hypothetical protein
MTVKMATYFANLIVIQADKLVKKLLRFLPDRPPPELQIR